MGGLTADSGRPGRAGQKIMLWLAAFLFTSIST